MYPRRGVGGRVRVTYIQIHVTYDMSIETKGRDFSSIVCMYVHCRVQYNNKYLYVQYNIYGKSPPPLPPSS